MTFLTGFPGFLASALVPHLLRRSPSPVVCLVQPRYAALAARRARALTREMGVAEARLVLVEGDLRKPHFGLADAARWQQGTTAFYHFAAAYDLGVGRALAEEVNVRGTEHALLFARACPPLDAFHYVSTCYVSGRYDGTFSETDLDVGQDFNNAYEETKFRAEVAVQQAMQQGLPATIYRPAIVVGDSATGETQKYDGPYYVIRWMLRWGRWAPVPIAPGAGRYTVNVVPRDFVVAALAHLSGRPEGVGKVYQLCDPDPLTVPALLDVLEKATGVGVVRVPVSPGVLAGVLPRVPPLQRAVGIEPQAFRYFTHPTRYTCAHTLADLDGTGIACPPFSQYASRLVDFVRAHPDIGAAAMV